jgi:hypothetical protein
VNNRPFSLDAYPFMVDFWEDESEVKCAQKATQLAVSMSCCSLALHKAYFKKRNQIYFFPTDDAVKDFVSGKFEPFIEENAPLKAFIGKTDNVHLKSIGSSMLYFRGMKSKSKMISISGDDLWFDEQNFFPEQKDIELAEKRASDAIDPTFTYISHPTVPMFGVSGKYDKSDQKEWTMKCPHCNEWNRPSEIIPKKLERWIEGIEGGFLECKRCERALDVYEAEWVAAWPDRKRICSGYWIPRFISPKANFFRIMQTFLDATDIQNFYNTELGLPYADADSRITYAEVMNLCSTYPMPDMALNCTMGVDVGEHQLWAVISTPSHTQGKLRDYLFIGEVKGEGLKKWANLEALAKQYGVKKAMIDSEPDPSAARDFVQKMGRRSMSQEGEGGNTFWLNRYVESKTESSWNADKQEMQCWRTESMDRSHRLLRDKLIQLPHRNYPIIDIFAKHCEGTAKQGEMDKKTFNMEYTWVKLGPDHLRHAFNYDSMLWYNGKASPKPSARVVISGGMSSPQGRQVSTSSVSRIKLAGWM